MSVFHRRPPRVTDHSRDWAKRVLFRRHSRSHHVVGGIIRNFFAGVVTNTATGIVIKHNQFDANLDSVDLQAGSLGSTVRHNDFRNSLSRGIMISTGSTEHAVEENTLTGNRVGILLFGGVDNLVHGNLVSASTLAGIRFGTAATGNRILKNTVASNPAGIEFLVTGGLSAVGNTVSRNAIEMNTCGLKGPVDGNTVEGNRFTGNGTDTCQ
jgi:parallel beta-helix repeat protein